MSFCHCGTPLGMLIHETYRNIFIRQEHETYRNNFIKQEHLWHKWGTHIRDGRGHRLGITDYADL